MVGGGGGVGRSAATYTHRAQLSLAFTESTPPAWGGGEEGGIEKGVGTRIYTVRVQLTVNCTLTV